MAKYSIALQLKPLVNHFWNHATHSALKHCIFQCYFTFISVLQVTSKYLNYYNYSIKIIARIFERNYKAGFTRNLNLCYVQEIYIIKLFFIQFAHTSSRGNLSTSCYSLRNAYSKITSIYQQHIYTISCSLVLGIGGKVRARL
jgi:hypothetical protein